jgi:phosphotransferase family enzyme
LPVKLTQTDTVATAVDACETEFGKRIEAVKEITSLPNADRTVLRVEFGGGLIVKLCVSTVPDYRLDTATQFADLIDGVRFPKILFRGEGWVAFEWIDGQPVSELPFDDRIIEGAARVLNAIHEAKIEIDSDVCPTTLEDVRLRLQQRMPLLVSRGIISKAQSDMISDLHHSLRPETLNISLIHGDFSPSNLVWCGTEFCVVDNDKMRIHVTDYDVCRASTFWEEWTLGQHSFLDEYRRQSKLRFDPASLRFWEVYDLVYRISYRLSARDELHRFCIMKLNRILTAGAFS